MSDGISWQVELTVRPGELENFRALTNEMVEFTRTEPGVLIYERFVGEDGASVVVYERFASSAAAVSHLQAFVELFGARFSGMVTRRRFMVFGTPGSVLRNILDRYDAEYLNLFAGFSRLSP